MAQLWGRKRLYTHAFLPACRPGDLFLNLNLIIEMFMLASLNHCVLCSGVDEVRRVKRNMLLEALAKELPSGTIRYSSKVVCIEESGFFKHVHLADETTFKTKVNSFHFGMVDVTLTDFQTTQFKSFSIA